MRRIQSFSILLVTLACGACGSNITCDDPERYQAAREGMRVSAPDDLDQLQASRETPIPKASPRDARAADAGCIDLPPTIQSAPANR
jgi:uncharacterized lipoprotein